MCIPAFCGVGGSPTFPCPNHFQAEPCSSAADKANVPLVWYPQETCQALQAALVAAEEGAARQTAAETACATAVREAEGLQGNLDRMQV